MRLARGLLLVPAVLAAAVGPALSGRAGGPLASSRAFTIDARTYLVGDPSEDGLSRIERELARRGIDPRPLEGDLRSVVGAETVEPLREGAEEVDGPRLPGGLEPEHVLRLQSGTGPVEITFGRLAPAQKDVLLRRLRSDGWKCAGIDAPAAPGAIAQLTGRKETTVVLLDTTEGRFLSIRRPAR